MAKYIELTIMVILLVITVAFGIYLSCQMIYATYMMYGIWWFEFFTICSIASILFAVNIVRILSR